MKKKVLGLLLATTLVVASIGGCKKAASDSNESPSGAEASPSAGETITLTYWDQWADPTTEPTAQAVAAALENWEKEYPNIKIKVDHTTATSEAYKTKIKTALSSGQAPDVFIMSKGTFAQPYIEAGKLLKLNDYLANGELDDMKEGIIDTASVDGGIYGIPFNMHVNGIYCNTELFEQNNIAYPTTWDEFIDVCQKFSELGITPIAMGNKELWQGIQLFEPILLSEGGYDYCTSAINGEDTFDSDWTKKSAEIMLQISQAEAFSKGVSGLTFTEGAAEFAAGKAAMTINGTWGLSSFEGEDVAVNGKVKIISFPTATDGQGNGKIVQAGPYEYYAVNTDTEHPKEAVQFALYMSKYISDYCYANGLGLPVWNSQGAQSDSVLFQQALDIANQAEGYMSGWDFYLQSDVTTEYENLVSALILNQISAEDFAKQLQEANSK
jgi:raffinose/stachyose/melibiose transport system substrate-binding protein